MSPRLKARIAGVFETFEGLTFPVIAGTSAIAEIPLRLWLM
jgi:hypothetical protein